MDEPTDAAGENRRAPRLKKRFILRAAVYGNQPLVWSFVTIHNLSSSGILFTYERPAYPGMKMHFRIDFPDRMIECLGRVVRVAGMREGVCHDIAAKFESMNPEDAAYIDYFVRSKLRI